jgi:hypothetical protein
MVAVIVHVVHMLRTFQKYGDNALTVAIYREMEGGDTTIFQGGCTIL